MTDELTTETINPENDNLNVDDPNNPLITVIVPCYNHGLYLTESVLSLINQTYKNLEIIIFNDGSNDSTKDVGTHLSKQFPNQVRYMETSHNNGKWNALNKAIEASKGIIITAQDADDISLPDRISRQLEAMKVTQSLHVLCGFHHCLSEEDVQKYRSERVEGDIHGIPSETVAKMVEYGFNTPGINHYFTGDIETAGVSAMFLKSVWNLGLRFNPPGLGLRIALSEDSDMNSRLTLLLRNTVVLAEKLYLYRRWTGHGDQRK